MLNAVGALAALALAAVPGLASPIFVSNFSFEELPSGQMPVACLADGCSFSIDTIPGWTASGTTDFGQFNPGNPANAIYFTSVSDGPTSGYANGPGAVLSQTVGEVVHVGDVYTLSVDIGYRLDLAFAGSASLQIGTNTPIAIEEFLPPTQGTFNTYKVTYIGTEADNGKSITINLNSGGAQGNFDNVHLDAVPEPMPFMLIGTSLLLLPALRRRRTTSKTRG